MHPGLNLNNFKFFHDSAECQSVSTAARRNFVTQSAISQGIQKLEKALGVKLTTHQRHQFKLTNEGERVFLRTQQIFRSLKEMQEELIENENEIKGPVHFVCPQSIAMSFILPAMQKLKKEHPEVSLHFKIGNPEIIHKLLKSGIVDFGIVVDSKEFNIYEKRSLHRGYFKVYTKKTSLHEGVLVDSKEGLNVDFLKKLYFKRYRKELMIKEELDSWEVVARFVEAGMSCGLLPDYLLEGNRYPGISPWQKKFPSIAYEVVAIYPKGSKLSRTARAYLEKGWLIK